MRTHSASAIRRFHPESVPTPPDLKPIWFQQSHLDLEIGAGTGEHAVNYALGHPDRHLIAIERTAGKFATFQRRLNQQTGLDNLTVIRGDAISWVVHAVPANSLERIFLLYPNPEPKNPAQRWARMPFMQFLLDRLKPGGEIHFATNISEYYREAKEYFVESWGLNLKVDEVLLDVTKARTAFERKYLLRGEPCYQMVMTRPNIGD